MENCLVTKFKVTVDNPNLPVLERMQQFTLDAITASGNSSMTDAQKLALNHFFYQIGAINNNGIYAKTDLLILPVICNNNRATAFINYKTNAVFSGDISTANVSFSEHGIVVASKKNVGTYTSEYPRDTNNLCLAMFGTQSGTYARPFTNGSSQYGYFKVQVYSDGSSYVGIRLNNNEKYYKTAEVQSIDGFIYNINNSVDNSILCKNGVNYTPEISGSAYLANPYSFVVSVDHSDTLVNIPIGAWFAGAPLSSDEVVLLSKAMHDLFAAFV